MPRKRHLGDAAIQVLSTLGAVTVVRAVVVPISRPRVAAARGGVYYRAGFSGKQRRICSTMTEGGGTSVG